MCLVTSSLSMTVLFEGISSTHAHCQWVCPIVRLFLMVNVDLSQGHIKVTGYHRNVNHMFFY